MRVVYVDVLFAVNLLLDYLLLVLTARLGGVYKPRKRLFLAACAGALASVVLYFPELPLAVGLAARAGLCAGVTALAFGASRGSFLRLCGLFCACTFALAGGVWGLALLGGSAYVKNGVVCIDLPMRLLLAAAAVIWVVLGISGGTRLRVSKKTAKLVATVGEHTVSVRALQDTGNLLCDPVTGRRVILMSVSAAAGLLEPRHRPLLMAMEARNVAAVCEGLMMRGAGAFRLVPYQTASGSGLLLAVKPDRLLVDGKEETGYLLGISPEELDAAGECRAVIGV